MHDMHEPKKRGIGSLRVISKMDSIFEHISENPIIKAIRQGFLYIMPIIIVGSFVLMALNLPIDGINRFLSDPLGENWRLLASGIHKGTLRIISLSALIAISYAYSMEHEIVKDGHLSPLYAILASLSCYVAFTPGLSAVINEEAAGPTGIFGAIVIALASTKAYLFFYNHLPRRKRTYAYGADAILLSSMHNVLPVMLAVLLFSFARVGGDAWGVTAYILRAKARLNAIAFPGRGLVTLLLYDGISHLMWFFGIHGVHVMEHFAQDVFVAASEINTVNVMNGGAPTQIVTKEFLDLFVYLGGAGCTLGLLIALFLAGRTSNVSRLARYSLLPGLFNINEIMLYGLPVIFNPYYLLPFLLTPVALSLTSYAAFASGLVPLTSTRVIWTTPIFLSGYVSTGSVTGALLQLFNLLLAAAIYLPFVRLHEKKILRNNRKIFRQLSREYNTASYDNPPQMLHRNDEFGMMARNLVAELQAAMHDPALGLHMEFQPKTTGDGRVCGAEALLRWNHPIYGSVSPLVVLGVGEEAGMSVEIGTWVLEKSFAELGAWQRQNLDLVLSVNLSPRQLKEDLYLNACIDNIIRRNQLDPSGMELELTEHAALDQSGATRTCLERLKSRGIHIAIDDFGMGHSSLLYLRDFYANVVKLDMSLVRSLHDGVQNQEIVRSIVTLCAQLQAGVVAEGVETREQIETLQELGCNRFQGWYFSKSLPAGEFLEYVQAHGTAKQA